MTIPPTVSFWRAGITPLHSVAALARRVEAAGFDGMTVMDSQCLAGDPYVAMAVAAASTSTLRLTTATTNSYTRHPSVAAAAAASVQYLSGGRVTLGIGRGDSSLAHIGRAPVPLNQLEQYVRVLADYLAGHEVTFERLHASDGVKSLAALTLDGRPTASRLQWLDRSPRVPVHVYASGPKAIAVGARSADGVVFTVGADPARVRWAIGVARAAAEAVGRDPSELEFGASVNLVVGDDQVRCRRIASGLLASRMRYAVMHGGVNGPMCDSDVSLLRASLGKYDMTKHATSASVHATMLSADFIDRHAIVGAPERCVERLAELVGCGVSTIHVAGAAMDATDFDAADHDLAAAVIARVRAITAGPSPMAGTSKGPVQSGHEEGPP